MPAANSFDARAELTLAGRQVRDLPARRAGRRLRPRAAAVLAEDPAREPAAQRGRRRRQGRRHRGARRAGTPTAEPSARSPSCRRACCCRTSPASPRSSTSPRCATRCRRWAATPRRSTRSQPVELVIDHSVQVDEFGTPRGVRAQRGARVLAQHASATRSCAGARTRSTTSASCRPTPASSTRSTSSTWRASSSWTTARRRAPLAYPDTLVGTDSHTTMINGLGVLGWGVGGIEAEAAMLGQPVSMLIPQVVGFRLHGTLPRGRDRDRPRPDRHPDAAQEGRGRQVRRVLRRRAWPRLPLADRATIANMAPEYGATCGIFPIDAETLRYLRFTGPPARADRAGRGLRQGAGHVPRPRHAEEPSLHRHARARPRDGRAEPGRAASARRTACRCTTPRSSFDAASSGLPGCPPPAKKATAGAFARRSMATATAGGSAPRRRASPQRRRGPRARTTARS